VKHFLKRALAVALAGACALAALAQAPAPAARPKIGLVLGGGGARGGAHMGVLEVLEEMRIPFDCVAGTSMGALVSGAYLAGVSPEEMKAKVKATDWGGMFDDSAGRESIGVRAKQIDDRFFSALEFGMSKDGLRYREGAVSGTKIKLFFNELVHADLGARNIEDLPLPLALMATDIGSGERVAMRSGDLTTAMRASMSVPGAVAPVLREGRKLVDGGLVDNVPIQEVHDLCGADVVIAVNVGSALTKPEDVIGILSVVGQMVNLLTEQNVSRSLALLKPTDIYMRPELGTITAASFDRQMEAADIGRKAALAQAEKLRRLSLPPAEYEAWRKRLRGAAPLQRVVDAIEIGETRFVNRETVRLAITQEEGKPLDTKQLDRDLVVIKSAGDLQTIDYAVAREREKTILRVTPVEKTLGPDYLRFGLNLYSDYRGDSSYNIRALTRRTWLNSLGGEWLTAAQIGTNQLIYTEFYQPLEPGQRWFVRPFAGAQARNSSLFDKGNRIAEYRTYVSEGGANAGMNFGAYGLALAGWKESNTRGSVETGTPILPSVRQLVGGPYASVDIDTHDFAFFPTRGIKLDLTGFEAAHVSEGMRKYGTAQATLGAAYTLGDFILVGAAEHGQSTHGTLPVTDLYTLGGPRHLAGFAPGQIAGDDYTYGSLEVQYKLTREIPLLGLQLIGGLQAEAGKMRKLVTEPTLTGWQQSYGAYLASNTAFGPFYLGFAKSPNGKGTRFYFFVGTP
jgi:NTE family protein